MKKLLVILMLLPVFVQAQRYIYIPGEYASFVIDTQTGLTYSPTTVGRGTNTGPIGLPVQCQYDVAPSGGIVTGAACLHGGFLVDASGNVYYSGANDNGTGGDGTSTGGWSNMRRIVRDSANNTFNGVTQICHYANGNGAGVVACKSDGTVWGWGNLTGGHRGSGATGNQNTVYPVQILGLAAGDKAIKVLGGLVLMVQTFNSSTGVYKVYTSSTSSDLSGTGNGDGVLHVARTSTTIQDIAGAGFFSFIQDAGNLYGWGYYINLWSGGTSGSFLTPTNVMSRLGFTAGSIWKFRAGPSTHFAILNNRTAWAWGEQICGGLGTGDSIIFANYGSGIPYPYTAPKFPFAWDQGGVNSEFVQMAPKQILTCDSTVDIFTGPTLGPYTISANTKGRYKATGRNKAWVAFTGEGPNDYVNGNSGSVIPNAVQWWSFKPIYPFDDVDHVAMAPYACIDNPALNGCQLITYPNNAVPTLNNWTNITSASSTVNLNLSVTPHGSGVGNAQIRISQITGGCETATFSNPAIGNGTVIFPGTGTYTLNALARDNVGQQTSQNITITITGANVPPTVTPGGPYTITLPTSSQIMSVTATGNGGATIAGYLWTKTSGPGATTILNNTTATATATGLQQGSYIFHCVVTDNNSLTTGADVFITVNAALPPACNCSYFFANSGSDANVGDSLNPFQTLAKLNLLSGDSTISFRLKRGNSWHEAITNFGGKSLTGYGAGVKPMINGFTTLTSFASLGGGIYTATCSGCNVNTNIVTIDGVQQKWARTPNTGMYNYTGWSSNNWIRDNTRTNIPHPGGYVSIRNYHANQTTNIITLQSGDTIKYTPSKPTYTASTAAIGYGYFFIGDSVSLDTAGEWWYSTVSQKMNLVGNPAGHIVKTTTIDTLISLRDGLKGTVIDGIDFEGAGIIAMHLGKDTNVTVSNCKFQYNGQIGTYLNGTVNTSITNCYYNQTNDVGIFAENDPDSARRIFLRLDTIENTGMLRGQGRLVEDYDAIWQASISGIVDRCKIDTCGYIGIMGYNDSVIINNSVLYSCMLLDDGAAYYHLAYTDSTKVHLVRGNIFSYAMGNIEGTADLLNQGYGAYWDNNGVNAYADSNTFYRNGRAGMFVHNTRKSKFVNNTFHKNPVQILIQGDDNTKPVSGNTFKGNIMSIDSVNQRTFAVLNGTGIQLTGTIGVIDSNYYAWNGSSVNQFYIFNGHGTAMNYTQWKDSTGETHASMPGPLGLFQYNATGSSISVSLNSSYLDIQRKPQFNSVTIPAYRSIFFLTGNFVTGMKRGQRIRFL